jgi:exodeoxyribonuclease-5
LINFVFSNVGNKLIFVGDEGQLPPVGSDFSPALNEAYLQNYYPELVIQSTRLAKVLRQAEDSDILLNATRLRSAPEGSFPEIQLTNKPDLVRVNGADLQDELETSYSNFGADETIIITRSNKRANQFNQQIRNRILWFEEDLCGGDMLMVVKNNYFWLEDKSEAGFIANGEILKVLRITKREELYGFHFAKARVQLVDYPNMGDFETVLMVDTLTVEAPSLPREQMKSLFFAIEEEYSFEKNKKKRYERIMKDPYFNALQVKFAYAITCHKSQGGQWASVFLDHGYLTEELLDKSFFRWLYTGFTRASERLGLVNFDNHFFKEPK